MILIMQHTPTYLAIVSVLAQHLRGDVVGGAAGGVQQLSPGSSIAIRVPDVQGRKAEIADFEVTVGV